MQTRKFDELISYFNRNVSNMDIDQKYKIELLGMITAIGFAHEKELHDPTIEPQRKKGKWIEHNPHKWGLGIVFECSECGEKIDCEPSNFCPNCGADMTEKSEEPKKCDTCKHEKERWFSRCADCSDYELWESKE